LSLALGKQEDYIAQLYEYPFIILHLLHYEKTISRPEDALFACGAHSDYSLFTFLLIDNEPGLEILLNG
jgi:isopenicillin N synthase-like dioxygenase